MSSACQSHSKNSRALIKWQAALQTWPRLPLPAAFQARSGVARHAALWRVPQLLERAYAAAGVAPDQLEAWRREGARLSEEALVLLCLGEGAGSA